MGWKLDDLLLFDCFIVSIEISFLLSFFLLIIQKTWGHFLLMYAVTMIAILKDCYWIYNSEKQKRAFFFLFLQDVFVICLSLGLLYL